MTYCNIKADTTTLRDATNTVLEGSLSEFTRKAGRPAGHANHRDIDQFWALRRNIRNELVACGVPHEEASRRAQGEAVARFRPVAMPRDPTVQDAWETLPAVYRDILQRKYWGGWTDQQIANDKGMGRATVTRLRTEGLAMLESKLSNK